MKLTDKDLLFLSAKAIGGAFDAPTESIILDGGIEYTQWNPLEDDGDALRLAVSLEIGVMSKVNRDAHERNVSVAVTPYSISQTRIVEKHNGNPGAATRYAIVRAAAEIGRAQP